MKRNLILTCCLALLCQCLAAQTNPYKKYTENLPFKMPEVKAPVFPNRKVNLSDYGAKGDGSSLCTTAFAKAIKKHLDKLAKTPKQYDLNKEPVYDILGIKKLLPHRYPFLLIDKIIEIGDDYVVGVKNVTTNEPFFQGHFPNQPVMPGVLQIEAMAQVGGVLVLKGVPDPENYSTFFLTIDNVKFRQKVVPGDTLVFHISYMSPIRRGCAVMKGYAFVGEKIVSEAEFMAQIIKNK